MLRKVLFKIIPITIALFVLVFYMLSFKIGSASDQPSAQEIILKMEQKFSKIENYQVDVSRIYHRSEVVKSREEWRFFFHDSGLVRVEVVLPKKVILVINQDDVWQHLLEEKKVVRRIIKDLVKEEKMFIIGKLLKPYEIEGWGLSISSNFGDRLRLIGEEVIRGRKCYLIECKAKTNNPQQLRLLVWIDQERLAVVKRELYKEKDHLVSRIESENFLEIIPGIWLPRKVESTIQTEKGEVAKRLVLRNIRMNKSLPEKTFQFSPPKGCEVVTFNNKGEIVKEH